MDDGANSNILIAFLTGAIIILLILLVYMIYVCKKNSVLSFKGVINGGRFI